MAGEQNINFLQGAKLPWKEVSIGSIVCIGWPPLDLAEQGTEHVKFCFAVEVEADCWISFLVAKQAGTSAIWSIKTNVAPATT